MSFQPSKRGIQFHFGGVITLFFLLLLMGLIALGVWQWHRYHDKQVLLSSYQHRISMKPLSLEEITHYSDKNFLPVRVKGRYENDRVILLQHRMYHRESGYEVITPFKISGQDRALLVNRGWVPRRQSLKELPVISAVSGLQTIQGHIKYWNEYQFILGKSLLNPGHWPLLIQSVDFEKLHQLLKLPLYPFTLQLDPNQANGFIRHWKPMEVLPERHLGYAIQWFALAFVLVIAFLILSIRRDEGKKNG